MHLPHSIRLTIQLTIDSESFRELTNTTGKRVGWTIFFTKEPLLRQLRQYGKTSDGVCAPGCSLLRARARPGTSTTRSAPQAGHEFAEPSAKQTVHRGKRRID